MCCRQDAPADVVTDKLASLLGQSHRFLSIPVRVFRARCVQVSQFAVGWCKVGICPEGYKAYAEPLKELSITDATL
jgi:hypothetical protein